MAVYRYQLLSSILDICAPYNNDVLAKVGNSFVKKVKENNGFDGTSLLASVCDQFYQHTDLPENAPITIPVAWNSFRSSHNFASAGTWD